VNLSFTAEDEAFREEVRDWLSVNVPSEARPLDGPESVTFDRAWQRRQYDAGWAGISWPRDYGGRGLSLTQQLIWHEEYARRESRRPYCHYARQRRAESVSPAKNSEGGVHLVSGLL
jgi:alkylation response protein AidB-like acyl-CoA dehydrogenase